MSKREKVMLFIDFQEKLMPAINCCGELTENTVKLAKGAAELNLPILVTEQYVKGLGPTIDTINEAFGGKATYFEKMHFSAVGEEGFLDYLEKEGKGYKEVVICGIETHICVAQTALDLVEKGYKVYVVEDCCGSRTDNNKKIAIDRMARAGVIITTYEAILFEILEYAKSEGFKEVSRIIK